MSIRNHQGLNMEGGSHWRGAEVALWRASFVAREAILLAPDNMSKKEADSYFKALVVFLKSQYASAISPDVTDGRPIRVRLPYIVVACFHEHNRGLARNDTARKVDYLNVFEVKGEVLSSTKNILVGPQCLGCFDDVIRAEDAFWLRLVEKFNTRRKNNGGQELVFSTNVHPYTRATAWTYLYSKEDLLQRYAYIPGSPAGWAIVEDIHLVWDQPEMVFRAEDAMEVDNVNSESQEEGKEVQPDLRKKRPRASTASERDQPSVPQADLVGVSDSPQGKPAMKRVRLAPSDAQVEEVPEPSSSRVTLDHQKYQSTGSYDQVQTSPADQEALPGNKEAQSDLELDNEDDTEPLHKADHQDRLDEDPEDSKGVVEEQGTDDDEVVEIQPPKVEEKKMKKKKTKKSKAIIEDEVEEIEPPKEKRNLFLREDDEVEDVEHLHLEGGPNHNWDENSLTASLAFLEQNPFLKSLVVTQISPVACRNCVSAQQPCIVALAYFHGCVLCKTRSQGCSLCPKVGKGNMKDAGWCRFITIIHHAAAVLGLESEKGPIEVLPDYTGVVLPPFPKRLAPLLKRTLSAEKIQEIWKDALSFIKDPNYYAVPHSMLKALKDDRPTRARWPKLGPNQEVRRRLTVIYANIKTGLLPRIWATDYHDGFRLTGPSTSLLPIQMSASSTAKEKGKAKAIPVPTAKGKGKAKEIAKAPPVKSKAGKQVATSSKPAASKTHKLTPVPSHTEEDEEEAMTLEERMMLAATAGPSNAAADPTDADLIDVGYQSSSLPSPGNLIATLAKEEGQSGQGAGGSRASSSSGSSDTWLAAFYKPLVENIRHSLETLNANFNRETAHDERSRQQVQIVCDNVEKLVAGWEKNRKTMKGRFDELKEEVKQLFGELECALIIGKTNTQLLKALSVKVDGISVSLEVIKQQIARNTPPTTAVLSEDQVTSVARRIEEMVISSIRQEMLPLQQIAKDLEERQSIGQHSYSSQQSHDGASASQVQTPDKGSLSDSREVVVSHISSNKGHVQVDTPVISSTRRPLGALVQDEEIERDLSDAHAPALQVQDVDVDGLRASADANLTLPEDEEAHDPSSTEPNANPDIVMKEGESGESGDDTASV
ncbi:hypothetical protein QCA50_020231 [Cerrena zonata]|uniref:Uncharacterized protein n=1 Tax=Cerrena zonata TaxID=2478898 RepID=A0AAW0FJK6_9APHY